MKNSIVRFSALPVLALFVFIYVESGAHAAVPPQGLQDDPIEISKYRIAHWEPGMNTKEAGEPLRKLIVESESMDEMIEAMTLLQKMQLKLRSEYSHEFPNLNTGASEMVSLEPADFMDNLRTDL
ncbi:MAG: hypothetical protein VCD00_13605 [Candidatus Hydrogenedentota bacterium]